MTTQSPAGKQTTLSAPFQQIRQIKRWFETAVPDPTIRNTHSQIGVHLEEVTEMLEVLRDAGASMKVREQLAFAVDVLSFVQKQIKAFEEGAEIELTDIDRTGMLDALCDQIVTAVGIAHMLKMDIEGGLQEVADSNDSKFDADGNPIFNAQMKIMKGPDYVAPDLTKFV